MQSYLQARKRRATIEDMKKDIAAILADSTDA
jgi:hypothetical protein